MANSINYWSVSSQVLKEEAENLGLTVEVLIPEKNLFIVRSDTKEVLFKSTDFGANSSLAMKISDDKEMTYALLEKEGVPVPKSLYVTGEDFAKFEAIPFQTLRFPVVIKPTNESHGNGVCMGISDLVELKKKLELSLQKYKKLIVQEQISGNECRVLVVLGKVILAINRVPPSVTWDGVSTIQKLIETENASNPLRGTGYNSPLSHIRIDSEMEDYIARQGFTLNSVLAQDVQIQLRWNSNLWSGGTIVDVTNILHPDTKDLCVRLAEKLQLGIVGVDIICSDFSRPLSEMGGVILELNDTPGLWGDRELSTVNTWRELLKRVFGMA